MNGPRAVRLHLGAHKTASTHLQRTLARHAGALRAEGIDFVPAWELCALRIAVGGRRSPRAGRSGRCRRAPFEPFDAGTVAGMRAAYARDLALLAADPTIRLLRQPVELSGEG
ncbi:MAG: hypothetical protein QM699_12785 [Amaricoccus sp.]|uniref:hypothetical protein n=1 Tax=Amaricoccus sp. TaxID=1872485 RepID=UPI0039E382DA